MRTRGLLPVLAVTVIAAGAGWAAAQPPAKETGFIQVEPDVRLFYQRFGNGTPTVFIPNVSELAIPFASLLYFHDVVMWDPRGRGLSDRPADLGRYGMEVEIADAEKVREYFGATDITYIGLSLWSMVALLYAAEHPESVASVVGLGLFEPAAELASEPEKVVERDVSAVEAAIAAMHSDGTAESDPYTLCRLETLLRMQTGLVDLANLDLAMASNMCQYPNEYGHNILPVVFEGIVGKWGDFDWRPTFATIQQPVLLIWGDHEWSLDGLRTYPDLLQDVRVAELENAGHAVWLEPSGVVVRMIDDFLRGR